MIVYDELFYLLYKKGMKRTDLLNIMSTSTLAKLGNNKVVHSDIISRICKYLGCQPEDIMDYISEKEYALCKSFSIRPRLYFRSSYGFCSFCPAFDFDSCSCTVPSYSCPKNDD